MKEMFCQPVIKFIFNSLRLLRTRPWPSKDLSFVIDAYFSKGCFLRVNFLDYMEESIMNCRDTSLSGHTLNKFDTI